MKSSVSFLLVVICTVVLAAQQSQAKKGCNAYGHACYGGHGKRSLGNSGVSIANDAQQDEIRRNLMLKRYANEDVGANALTDDELDARYRLMKIMKSWFGGHARRPSEQLSEIEYPDTLSRDSNNSFKK